MSLFKGKNGVMSGGLEIQIFLDTPGKERIHLVLLGLISSWCHTLIYKA